MEIANRKRLAALLLVALYAAPVAADPGRTGKCDSYSGLPEGRGETAGMVLVPGGLASLMTALPAIRSIRRELPEARLDLVAEPLAASLMARDPVIDHAFDWLPLPPLRQRRPISAPGS